MQNGGVSLSLKRWIAVLCGGILLFTAVPMRVAAAPSVSSLSAVVYEPESGLILYEKDGQTARPMASTTKLMTALLAAELLDANAMIDVPAAALPVEGSQVGLAAGDSITVRDLLAGLLLSSGNDTANVLALLMDDSFEAFAARMNTRALELGMAHSRFVTPSGLDKDGHSASARDMARLGAAVLKHPLLKELTSSKTATITINGIKRTITNHNKLLQLYDGVVGLKTGFTKKAGRCLVSAVERDGITLVVATLNGGDYWNDHMALYKYGFTRVRRERMPDVSPKTCAVAGGTVNAVALVPEEIPSCVLAAGESVTAQVELPAFIWAPVECGQALGCVRYVAGERELATVSLRAAEAVAERALPPWYRRIWRRFCLLSEQLLR